MELWIVKHWKVDVAVQVLSGSSFKKKLVQQEMLFITYDWDMASVPVHCISGGIPCQLIVVLLTKCHLLSYSSVKTRFLLFCPGCTPEWTTLLLLSPGTLLVWLYEHTGTIFSIQNSYWVLKLFFFGETNSLVVVDIDCSIQLLFRNTHLGWLLGTKVSFKSSVIVVRNPLQTPIDFFCVTGRPS